MVSLYELVFRVQPLMVSFPFLCLYYLLSLPFFLSSHSMSGEERAGNRRELKAEEGVEEDWKVSENLLPGLYFTFPGNGLSILLSYSSSFTSPFHELLSSLSPARQIKVWPGEGKIESSGKV